MVKLTSSAVMAAQAKHQVFRVQECFTLAVEVVRRQDLLHCKTPLDLELLVVVMALVQLHMRWLDLPIRVEAVEVDVILPLQI
jgi:hypothetical protein